MVEEVDELEGHLTVSLSGGDAEDVRKLGNYPDTERIRTEMNSLSEHRSSINCQIEDQESWFETTEARLSKLQNEEQFHQIQKELIRWNRSKNQFNQAQKIYEELVSFGESVRLITQVVKNCLTEQLEEEIPSVEEDLTKVFAALTRHPWYDTLTIDKDKLPKLELQVGSSRDPFSLGHPIGVLNGQAESALDLVPHFTFSQEKETPTEVYLVLMDDPTRAFDDEHIEILIELLAKLGRNVQLIVGSHETSRFTNLLPTKFESGSYVVVEPTCWSYQDGPSLDIRYE